jgi:hypothetical protein
VNLLRIHVPADERYDFAPRVTAAWLVASGGAEIDIVEDAREAVDEAVAPLMASGCAVTVLYVPADEALAVEVQAVDPGASPRLLLLDRA